MENCQQVESGTALCKRGGGGGDAENNSDGLNRGVELMNVDHCRKVPLTEDSNLVDVAVRGDGGGMGEVKLGNGVKVVEMKRRRGRPPKNPARNMSSSAPAPVTVRKKDEEDVCFICFDGGSLVLCDRHGCPKAYHPACIKRDEAFFRSKAKWNCGWHICSTCQKSSYYMCYTCTYSLCKNCTKGADYVNVRGNKGFCGLCLRTIMLIENSTSGNKEMVQVDFDDKTSWEYLFKMYWVFLKEKLSLTLDELTKAKNPWKENAIMEKPFGDLGASFSKKRKMLKQQAFFNKVESVEAEKPGIAKNHLRPTDIISKRSEAVATQMAVLGNSDGPPVIAIDTRCKTHEKVDEKGQKANPDEFAAIDVHNMNLIYLRRSLMENLIDDVEKFNDKVVGSFVRIRIPCDQKQDIYRLVQVVGTIKAAEPYKIGEKTIDVMIEILNLDKKEVVSINGISNQELSEDECQQLRQSIIKSGQIKWFTVGEILEKAMALQAVRVNDCLDSEILRVKNLCNQASKKGDTKELRECEEKLQLLNSPDERHRRLHEIPDIHRDPNRNLFSDEASGELDEKKKGMELSVNSIEADKIWHYQDPLGKIQGPFAMAMLRGWSSSGHFPPELRVRRVSEKQENSILLTDALVGQYSQLQQLVQHSRMPTEDASMATEDGCRNRDEDARESKDQKVNQMESKHPEGSLNLMQNDTSGHCQNNDSAKSKELGSQSSTCTAPVDIVSSNAAETGNSVPHWDSMKGDNYFPGQPQLSSSLPASTISEKPCETQSDQVSKGHGVERWDCGSIDMNLNLNKTSEGQIIDGNVKQDDNDGKSVKPSGQCWRAPPLNDGSNGWNSNSGLLYLARALEVSELNQDIDFPDIPTSTSKLNHEDSKGQDTKNKQSLSSNVPQLDSGPTWSTASSLVGNGPQLPEVAGEWGGYSSNSKGKHRLDKYYQLAKEHGYRSRASWKLVQLDSKFSFLKSAHAVLDLCAAPGGWMQVAVQRVPVGSLVLGIDLVPIAPIRGAVALQQDITKSECKSKVKRVMEEHGVMAFDVILHDGSPNVGGAWAQEAMSQNALVIDSVKLATQFLAPKGTFVTKIFRSQDYSSVLYCLKQLFEKVEVDKPAASRSASAEIYLLGLKYKAPAKIDPRLLDVKHLFQGSTEPQKKVIDVLRVSKQKRHRDGYEDGETISKKASTAADFIWSDSPLEILGSVTSITFADPASLPIKDHSSTTEEVKALCDDLRVLGKQDFKYLLKWRMQLRKALSPEKATPTPTPSTVTDVNKGDEENEDDKLLNEMEELTYAMERKKKREKKLLAKRQAKDKSRKATGMQIDALEDGYVDHELFSLSSIKGKKDLAAVDSNEYDDGNVDVRGSEDEENQENTEDESFSDIDSDEERRRYDERIEEILDHAYEEYAAKKDGKTKQRKRVKQAYEQLEGGDDDDVMISDHDSDKDVADLEANPLMVSLDNGEGPTEEEITNRWFSQDIFGEAVEQGDLGKYDSGDEMEVDNRDEKPVIPEKSIAKKKQDEKSSIPDKAKEKKVNNAAGPKSTKLQGASKAEDDFEIVPAPATDSSDDSSSDDSEDDDVETKAEILACAKKMLRKKQRDQILDDAYNKYMFDDDGLPKWFLEEEKRHRQPIKPVTKEEIAAMRAQFKEINARPAKKVAEAKARKKRIAMKKLEKVRQKANSISDQADISERSKRKQIEQLYKKATPKKPQREYVVAKKGVQVRAGKGKVLVDRRMKKDARARATGKSGKGSSKKGKNGKVDKKGKGSGKASGRKGNKNKGSHS